MLTRVVDAPRDLVFKAWTDPKQVVRWWGPNGFTTTTHEMDVRPGGAWRFTMHGPDGRDYENKIVYTERSVFETAAERERVVREYGAIEGGKQTLERLAADVTKLAGRAS